MDEARGLVSDATLWPRVRDFLWDFAPQIHESWVEGLKVEGPKVEGLEEEDTGRTSTTFDLRPMLDSPRVRRFVLDSLGVEPCFHAFPKDDWSRLALLDGSTLLEIAKWLGALACAGELRHVTDGKTVKALKAALPGVYPEVFGYTEYFRRLKVEKLKVEKITPQSILATGVECLFAVVSSLPQPIARRLVLKLPSDLSTCDLSAFQPFNFSTLQLLLKLRFPEAHSLCC